MEHPAALQENGSALREGDQATFTLNLSESKIYMSINGKQEKVIFQDIEKGEDIQYKFAIAYYCPIFRDAISIIDIEDSTFQD